MYYLEYFEEIMHHQFKDKSVLKVALTHSSYANETDFALYNERLEFLGDSVLGFIIAEQLFTCGKHLAEGEMSKARAGIVCERSLCDCAIKMNLGEYLFLGKGEEMTGGRTRPSLLADATEALIAALYLDGGIEKARRWVLEILSESIQEVLSGKRFCDYKTGLQEKLQGHTPERISYKVLEQSGPDHSKTFVVAVFLGETEIGRGSGRTKKDAEQAAAEDALKAL